MRREGVNVFREKIMQLHSKINAPKGLLQRLLKLAGHLSAIPREGYTVSKGCAWGTGKKE